MRRPISAVTCAAIASVLAMAAFALASGVPTASARTTDCAGLFLRN